jgi:hypothetical protein
MSARRTRVEAVARTTDILAGTEASFAAAVQATGAVHVSRYEIAGAQVWLRFASEAMRERLTPAFAHLAIRSDTNGESPTLTVNLWDSASTGADPPSRPPTPAAHAPGALFHLHDPPLRWAYQPGVESLSVLDSEARVAWFWVPDALDQPYWDEAAPIRQILSWWLTSRGYLQVHGGAVGTPEGGVLLVGQGGSGKSTVALSTLGSTLLYAGDDYVAVKVDPTPQIESLYCSGKLEPAHVDTVMPRLRPLLANADRLETEKAVIYVQAHFPSQVTRGFPLRAVLAPKVRATRAASRIVETSRASAFAALAPSTMFQLHTAGPETLTAMSKLIERVPCYLLEIGSDLDGIPATIADFLARLPTP